MHSNTNPDNSKVDDYLRQEIEGQFSQSKLDEIYAKKFGKSKLSPELAEELHEAQNYARRKGFSVTPCEVCGRPAIVKNVREGHPLCDTHLPFLKLGLGLMAKNGGNRIMAKDLEYAAQRRTTMQGPFYNPKDPTGELRRKGIIK